MKLLICLFNFLLLFAHFSLGQEKMFRLLPSPKTGVSFNNTINETEKLNVLAYEYFYNGGGVAAGDINNDGLIDLFFTANMKPNKLYLNLGGLRFKDITKTASAELEGRAGGWKTGASFADVNGDGLLDIYVCYSGKGTDDERRNQLFINKGNLQFEEKAKEFGIDDKSYGTQAAFFDADNDGDLDLFLLNHSVKKIDNLELARYRNDIDELSGNKLFRNDNNHFTDITQEAGIRQSPLTFGLGIAIGDINRDGWPDIYVTNDYNEQDYCYINKKDGTFEDHSSDYFRYLAQFSMGVDIADYNNDGWPDIITLDMLPEDNRRQKLLQLQENYENFQLMVDQGLHKQYMRNMLQLNNGDGTFSEIGRLAGVSSTDWSWAPLFADLDNDGFKDLFITNGYLRDYTNKDFLRYWGDYKVKKAIEREPVQLMDLIKAMPVTTYPNYVYRNNHDLTFSNQQTNWGIEHASLSNGAVYVDLDNDGDLDLVVNNINKEAFIYQNLARDGAAPANYLDVDIKGRGANQFAIGAQVTVYAAGMQQFQEVNPVRGYLSSIPTRLHFGVGQLKQVDSIRVLWPGNVSRLFSNVSVNQLLQLTPEGAVPHQYVPPPVSKPVFAEIKGIPEYKHQAGTVNDFKRQLLMLFMYSNTGPVLAAADVNKDGFEDLFVSGDATQPATLFLQDKTGNFSKASTIAFPNEEKGSTSAALFFDANTDGFPDLYIARGGYNLWETNTEALQDELWINDGKGQLIKSTTLVPDVSGSSKSCIRAADVDGDGDLDLFIGGRVVPGKYPVIPESYLLINEGEKGFVKRTGAYSFAGMVTDAQWEDINKDGRPDLVVCGEFMSIKVYMNTANGLEDRSSEYFPEANGGFWNAITFADINGDGARDLIAGNLGLNSVLHPDRKEPAELYFADFDGNGSIDPFLNFYVQGQSFPFVSRDELNEQIYPMRKKFTSYRDYAIANMKDIVGEEGLAKATKLEAQEAASICFINRNGKFEKTVLPLQAQFSMVSRILVNDFTGDGKQDLLLMGNHSDNRLKFGSLASSYGCLLEGDGKGGFRYCPQGEAGLSVNGDVKSMIEISRNGGMQCVLGVQGGSLIFLKQR